jgi:hypothetical protein
MVVLPPAEHSLTRLKVLSGYSLVILPDSLKNLRDRRQSVCPELDILGTAELRH